MNFLSFIYLFSLYVLFVPGIMYKNKHMLLHALLFTIILYFTFDFVYKTRESMNSDISKLHGLVNTLNKEINDKIINANVTNVYNITPESDNSGIVELCEQTISQIEGYKKQVEDLTEQLSQYEGNKELILSLHNTIIRLNEEQESLETKIEYANEVISNQQNTIEGRNKEISVLDETVSDKENTIDFQDNTIDEKDGKMGNLNTTIEIRNSTIINKDIKIGSLLGDNTSKQGEINNNKLILSERDGTIGIKDDEITKTKNDIIPNIDDNIKQIEGNIKNHGSTIDKQNKSIKDLDTSMQKCLKEHNKYDNESVVSFWNFAKNGRGNVSLYSGANIVEGQGLVIPNTNAWAQTNMRTETLPGSKTLVAWATVSDNSRSRGGAPISIFQNETTFFDAIVWAEREQNKWMVGSDWFRRTRSPRTPVPTSSTNKLQYIAFTQEYEGNIVRIKLYIDGKKVDEYTSNTKVTYGSNTWNFLFGPRHLSRDRRNRSGHFIGTIHAAGLFNKALSSDEVQFLPNLLYSDDTSNLKLPVFNNNYYKIGIEYWLSTMKHKCINGRNCFYNNYKTLGEFLYDFEGQGISFKFKSVPVANNWSHRNPYVIKGSNVVPMKYVKAWT